MADDDLAKKDDTINIKNTVDNKDAAEYLEMYKKQLFEEIGLSKLPPDKKKEYEEKLENIVNTRIINLIMIYLPEENVAEFGKLVDEGDQKKIMEFTYSHIPSFEDKVFAEMVKIKEELLERLKLK